MPSAAERPSRLTLIVAVSKNGIIGQGNQLPWHLPADLRRFKQLTMGHCLIMGRKTFESLGKPLPGRTSIVLSRRMIKAPPGVLIARSFAEALRLSSQDDEAFVIGGSQIYSLSFPHIDRACLTLVNAEFRGDAVFPVRDFAELNFVKKLASEQLLLFPHAREGDPFKFFYSVLDKTAPLAGAEPQHGRRWRGWKDDEWRRTFLDCFAPDEKNRYEYCFVDYERIPKSASK